MNQLNFGGAVIPAMAGFFFGKRAKVQEVQVDKIQLPAVVPTVAGETGVSRYLMAAPVVSGVTKYLKKKDKEPVTGVAVYLLRQNIAERNAPRSTSVSKYLAKTAKDTSRKKSSVDKYFLKQELAEPKLSSLTGVARYQAEQDLLARKKAAAALAQKYREAEAAELLAKQEALMSGAHYSEEEILAAEASLAEESAAANTGVGRYLQQTAKNTTKPVTGVAKYIAKQIIVESQKPALSKVGLYLRSQEANKTKKPVLTGVARYLSKLPTKTGQTISPKEKLAPSGVSRYLLAQEANGETNKMATSVAKYIANKSKEEADKIKKLEHLGSKLDVQGEIRSVEGEFIPAGSVYAQTGVSRYLERVGGAGALAVAGSNNTEGRATGVSRYLERQSSSRRGQTLSSVLTGVDRYLRKKVS